MSCYGQCSVMSATLKGVDALPVSVEVSISRGMPGFCIVGMPDTAIHEAKERIRSALQSCGFVMPNEKVVINLAPGSLKKSGSGFDLPIAIALLGASNQIERTRLENALFVGELSLGGEVKEVPGLLACAQTAKELGLAFVTALGTRQLVAIEGLEQFVLGRVSDMRNESLRPAATHRLHEECKFLDFKDIAGHDYAKRGLQIAAAGGHGVLMMGPPGSGKTMLASRMPSILPELSEHDILEAASIHSIAGEDPSKILSGIRPFRAPHHTATLAGLVGGGNPIRPGEVSLAHHGVLFLDEIPEFRPSVLQGLRQPLESGSITLTRAEGNVTFPASFALIAAANPCPCGFYGDDVEQCQCTLTQIHTYQNRIGGPLLDRIDIRIDVGRMEPSAVLSGGQGTSSETLSQAVKRAREYASWRISRQTDRKGLTENLVASCRFAQNVRVDFERIAKRENMSGRAIIRTLSVARTIADMEEEESVREEHLYEALQYRLREKVDIV